MGVGSKSNWSCRHHPGRRCDMVAVFSSSSKSNSRKLGNSRGKWKTLRPNKSWIKFTLLCFQHKPSKLTRIFNRWGGMWLRESTWAIIHDARYHCPNYSSRARFAGPHDIAISQETRTSDTKRQWIRLSAHSSQPQELSVSSLLYHNCVYQFRSHCCDFKLFLRSSLNMQ